MKTLFASDKIHPRRCQLRSSTIRTCLVLKTQSPLGDRSFQTAGSQLLRNSLIRAVSLISSFLTQSLQSDTDNSFKSPMFTGRKYLSLLLLSPPKTLYSLHGVYLHACRPVCLLAFYVKYYCTDFRESLPQMCLWTRKN